MKPEHRLRFKTLIMVLLLVLCANAGDLMLKRGMSQIGAVTLTSSGLARALNLTVHNPTIWIAILFLCGFMISYMTVMSWADYSYVMPAGAFGYVLLTLLAVVVLHEKVSWHRWAGVLFICVGVILVGQTNPRSSEKPPGISVIPS